MPEERREGRRNLKLDDRGVAYAWIVILISIFAVMVCYTVLYDPLVYFYDYGMSKYGDREEYANLMNNVMYMVHYFVVPFIISLVIYGIVSAIRREGDYWR
jgi:flagellar biosynthesis protein FlhB